MAELYSPASRALQDRFDTRRLADRLAEVKVHDQFSAGAVFVVPALLATSAASLIVYGYVRSRRASPMDG